MRLSLNIGEVKDAVVRLNFDTIRRFFLGFILANFEGKFFSQTFPSGGFVFTNNTLGYIPTDAIILAQVPNQTGASVVFERCTKTQICWYVATAPVTVRAFIGRYRSSL